jgi:hypothetical protein
MYFFRRFWFFLYRLDIMDRWSIKGLFMALHIFQFRNLVQCQDFLVYWNLFLGLNRCKGCGMGAVSLTHPVPVVDTDHNKYQERQNTNT